ncbi:MAG TPA: hypothetical protein VK783_00865 [Bacteroidia bacterium]|jgi:hypothetical protein|nr:hypothetical protein [Bacteroidia bacterium]
MRENFDPKNIKITPETFTKVKQMFRQNKCFYPGCENKAIRAHSIQEAGPLQTISGNINIQESQVYSIEDDFEFDAATGAKISKQKVEKKLHSCSISTASTFTGFCIEHDALFHPIDNNSYDGSKFQNFLYAYRTFAYSQHKYYEMLKASEGMQDMRNDLAGSMETLTDTIKGFESMQLPFDIKSLGLSNLTGNLAELYSGTIEKLDKVVNTALLGLALEKDRFDHAVENKTYSSFQYYARSIDGVYPITSSCVIPFLDTMVIPSSDGVVYSPNYALNILPEKQTGKTHIIFGVFPENPNVQLFYSKLNVKSDTELLKFISDILIRWGQNTYFSPNYWNTLSNDEKNAIIEARNNKEKNEDFGIMQHKFNLFGAHS